MHTIPKVNALTSAGEIFKEYKSRIFWLAFKVVRKEAGAKAALQDAFLKIIKNLNKLRAVSDDINKRLILPPEFLK